MSIATPRLSERSSLLFSFPAIDAEERSNIPMMSASNDDTPAVANTTCMARSRNIAAAAYNHCSAVFERVASVISSARTTFLNCIPHLPGHRSLIMIEPQGPLNAEMRENRIRQGDKRIANKLEREFIFAQVQEAQEENKRFKYLSAPKDFKQRYGLELIAQSKTICDYEVGVCHCIGRRPTMEDGHLATSFALHIGGRVYPVKLFGIFDGHGGRAASVYVKKHLERKLNEMLTRFCSNELTDEGIWNALKQTFVALNIDLPDHTSGTTANVVMFLDDKLWTANVGDSRSILDNGIQLSEDAKPDDDRYKRGIENRGGTVENCLGVPRVNGRLAVARAVGDHLIGSAISARPKITAYPLSLINEGSHLILACDGIYDVSSTRQVAKAVSDHNKQTAVELAENIVYSSYQARSQDNLSVLVVKFPYPEACVKEGMDKKTE